MTKGFHVVFIGRLHDVIVEADKKRLLHVLGVARNLLSCSDHMKIDSYGNGFEVLRRYRKRLAANYYYQQLLTHLEL